MNGAVNNYIITHSKSQLVGFLLSFFLGPLGLFYSSWVAALILLVIAASSSFATIIGPIICWMLSTIISVVTVSSHNEKVIATANLNRSQ